MMNDESKLSNIQATLVHSTKMQKSGSYCGLRYRQCKLIQFGTTSTNHSLDHSVEWVQIAAFIHRLLIVNSQLVSRVGPFQLFLLFCMEIVLYLASQVLSLP